MIEILLLISLCGRIGNILREKGRKPFSFQLLAVGLWFGGEIVGGIVGTLMDLGAGAYLLALLGAAGGAWLSFRIARKAVPAILPPAQVAEVFD